MVERLVAKGADMSDRNNPFHATPLAWADHNKQTDVCRWMRRTAPSICTTRSASTCGSRSRPAFARIPRRSTGVAISGTFLGHPLHWAAKLNREEMAKLLLEKGADPNMLAGNGLTALDLAEQAHAVDIAELIEQHGGKRGSDL